MARAVPAQSSVTIATPKGTHVIHLDEGYLQVRTKLAADNEWLEVRDQYGRLQCVRTCDVIMVSESGR